MCHIGGAGRSFKTQKLPCWTETHDISVYAGFEAEYSTTCYYALLMNLAAIAAIKIILAFILFIYCFSCVQYIAIELHCTLYIVHYGLFWSMRSSGRKKHIKLIKSDCKDIIN